MTQPVPLNEPGRPLRIEPRWPVVLTVLAVLLVMLGTPARTRLLPPWCATAAAAALLLPIITVWLGHARPIWVILERAVTIVFSVFAEAMILATLHFLVYQMVNHPQNVSGRQLLATSVGAWVTNILVFSMIYWQMDRGGPHLRANDRGVRPDWLFPQVNAAGDVPAGWRPVYADYLFLSFSTATAFSTTDVMPLTTRAKMLMMFESLVSLTTLVVVVSRAINILGS